MARRTTRARRGWRTAATSDPHELYELAVQNVESECAFIDRAMKAHRGRRATSLREDFCGTFAASVGWVQHRKVNTAIAIDLDRRVLAWGKKHNLPKLSVPQRERLTVRRADVLTARTPPVDVVAAWNFSYFIFKSRERLIAYFRSARAALKRDGLLILDAYGGSDALAETSTDRHLDGFTYVWDQHTYDPITNDVVNYIHFNFPDGTALKRAFRYDWRLWSLPEIQECLKDAGFRASTVYWEGTEHKTGTGNGVFRPAKRGEACEGWIAYVVAEA